MGTPSFSRKPVRSRSRRRLMRKRRFPTAQLETGASSGLPLFLQRQPIATATPTTLRPPPMLARTMGSQTLDRFALNSAQLTPAHQTAITDLAATLTDLLHHYPSGTLSITGHTDATGTETHNTDLGQQRADAVQSALGAAGISTAIMTVSSAGEGNLRVDTDAPNPRNRRVEIRFQPELPFNLGLDLPSLRRPSLSSGIPSPDADPASASPDISLDVPSPYNLPWRSETSEEAGRRIFTPVPELNLPRLSLRQAVFDRLDEGLNSVMNDLNIPEWAQGLIRDGAHAAVSRSAESLLDTALDQARVTVEAREALQTTFRALVQVEVPLR